MYGPTLTGTSVMIGRIACWVRSSQRAIVPSGGGVSYIPPLGSQSS